MLAAYTYSSGLRAPALIAFVKDTLIYLVIIVAVIYVGGEDRLRRHVRRGQDEADHAEPGPASRPACSSRRAQTYWAYATLAFGSALALFMYPHSMTAVLAAGKAAT